jgi:hypothetical protein
LIETKQLLININIKKYDNNNPFYQYFMEFSEVNSIETVIFLNNQFMLYIITKINIFNKPKKVFIFVFIFDS